MYTVKVKSKTVGFSHKDRSYVIGFRKINVARKVMYDMDPEPNILLHRKDTQIVQDIVFDARATLLIPKKKYPDNMFYIATMHQIDFYGLPTKGIGIVIPHELVFEDDSLFEFSTHVVEPIEEN